MPENITDVSQWEANIQFPTDGDGANGSVHEPIWQKIGNRTRWLYDNMVRLSGNQNIAGSKTFTSSPIVPTPTAATHAATKQYVDDQIGTPASGLPGGPPAGTASDGYVKHRNGTMEHWQIGPDRGVEGDYTFSLPADMTTVLSVQVSTRVTGGTNTADYWYQVVSVVPGTLTLRLQSSRDTPAGTAAPLIRVLGTY